ncbi:hypothetical protein N8I77_010268 [Diaporthe amygdali]|uniref:Heterokaryon incompatibility domain-containing protein n=1 Tax=Phomopsis amygdali TaxID=1214568 RepID=A0AAD9VZ44_PHOAM|nr:hypothetical protein N8I77_010268 [Diaporthe amygdali]
MDRSEVLPGVSFAGLAIDTVWDSHGGEVTSLKFCLIAKYKDDYLRHLTIPEEFDRGKWHNHLEMARYKLNVYGNLIDYGGVAPGVLWAAPVFRQRQSWPKVVSDSLNQARYTGIIQDKLPAFERGLPTTSLRKTFQDALTIAQRLDKYLWMDSLSIIQSGDDDADWRKECTTMAQVYSNSFCNISADWGDENNGLFFQRDDSYSPCHVTLTWRVPENRAPYLKSRPSPGVPHYIVQPNLWHDEVVTSPLNCRGWILQERLLSPRAMSFSPQQISWECGQGWKCEILPSQILTSILGKVNFSSLKGQDFANEELQQSSLRERRRLCLTGGELPVSRRRNLLDWWSGVVEDYMIC